MNEDEGSRFVSPEAEEEFHRLITKPVAKERGFLPTAEDGDLL